MPDLKMTGVGAHLVAVCILRNPQVPVHPQPQTTKLAQNSRPTSCWFWRTRADIEVHINEVSNLPWKFISSAAMKALLSRRCLYMAISRMQLRLLGQQRAGGWDALGRHSSLKRGQKGATGQAFGQAPPSVGCHIGPSPHSILHTPQCLGN